MVLPNVVLLLPICGGEGGSVISSLSSERGSVLSMFASGREEKGYGS